MFTQIWPLLILIASSLVSLSPAGAANPAEEIIEAVTEAPLRVLLLSGANNHNWKATTPEIKRILENSGRFEVDVLEQTHTMTAALLADYDVLVSNFNTFVARYKSPRDPGWTADTKQAYIEFVSRGGGHVVVHAGSSSFYNWPEYQDLVSTSFRVGQTDHGTRHEFPVRLDVSDHPITRGMSAFTTFDELWHDAPVPDDATILASAYSAPASRGSGHYESVAMVKPYGAGRSFTLLLGHDTRAMENSAFQTLLTRGTEWAATGNVTIPIPKDWPGIDSEDLPTHEDPLHWQRGAGMLALVDDDHTLWQFNYSAKAGKPYFHPVSLSEGPSITADRPADHPWHYGLWFSWKFINGANYWEEDRTTGKAEGSTEWTITRLTTEENHTAHVEMDLTYHVGDAKPVIIEQRTIDISAPNAQGEFYLDWKSTFTAQDDVVLDRTPLPDEPGGKVFGGYAGLSVRLAGGMRDRQVVSTGGAVEFENDRHRSRANGLDYSGVVEDQQAGFAIIDHPQNLNAPTPWYVIKGPVMSYFSPAVLCYGKQALAAGEQFTLRYRIMVHSGAWDEERLTTEVAKYVNEE